MRDIKKLELFGKPVAIRRLGILAVVVWPLNFLRYLLELACVKLLYKKLDSFQQHRFDSFMDNLKGALPEKKGSLVLRDKGLVPRTRDERYRGDRRAKRAERVLFSYGGEKPRRYASRRTSFDIYEDFHDLDEGDEPEEVVQ